MTAKIQFKFEGVEGYEDYRDIVKSITSSITQDYYNTAYYIAINEAVCNALLYGKKGPVETIVNIDIRINQRVIITKVHSDSKEFDVLKHQTNLIKMSESTEKWFDFLKFASSGRGTWMMLAAVEKIIYGRFGNDVVLISKLPYSFDRKNEAKELVKNIKIRRE